MVDLPARSQAHKALDWLHRQETYVSLAALPSSLICGMLRVVDHQEDQYLQYIITDACYGQIPNPFQFELSLSELQELLIRI